MSAILEGVRILDFGRYIAGPLCAAMLGDLGAEVIRVERPGGGDDRFLMPATADGEGAMFLQSNRGKQGVTLDIATPEGKAIARKLIATSDVVVANFSPGALRHLELDYASLSAIRPDIILTSISAFDSRSEARDAVGFDGIGQAISGAIYLSGEPGRPYRSAASYVDFSTAMAAAYGTLAAIIRRMKTGMGTQVEATLAGTALNIMNPILIEQSTGSNIRVPTANRSPIAGPSDIFAANDGWFIMQVIGQAMFKRWTRLVDRADLLDDPRFADDILRGRNGEALSEIMAVWAATRSCDECVAQLAAAGLAASPLLTPADIIGGRMGLAGTYFDAFDYPGADAVPIAAPAARLLSEEKAPPRRPPLAGEHNRAVFGEIGLTASDIDALRKTGII
jgi:crotonobetainyl-CoA:carnitine CoA-transferase CaiB-like acyl-CoA transferase